MTKKLLDSHYLIHSGIILILIIGWLIFSIYFASLSSFSVITSAYNNNNFTNPKTSELHAKEKVAAQFQAKENNLGIISVRFNTFKRINNDTVKFRIKESARSKWFYEGTYKVDQFQPDKYFTFGFPIITDSQNKLYQFEIESTKGEKGDAVAISQINPAFTAQYQYTKQELLQNKALLPEFLAKKVYYSFSDINFTLSSLTYLLPLAYYIFWYLVIKPRFNLRLKPFPWISIKFNGSKSTESLRKFSIFFHMYFFVIFVMIFFLQETNNYVYLMLLVLWAILTTVYKLESNISYLVGLFLLLLCPLLIIIGQESIAEKSAMWAYFFLVIGTAQALIEIKRNTKNLVGYKIFLENVFRIKY